MFLDNDWWVEDSSEQFRVIVSPDASAAGGVGSGIGPDGRIAMKVPITSTAAEAADTVESTMRERRRR